MAVGERAYTATEEQAMAIIRRWCDEGWTKGNVDVADEIIHPNFKVHGAGGQVIEPGIEGLKALIRQWRTGFPDAVQRVEDIYAVGDKVTVRLTWEGTHLGEFMGVPATGKPVSVETIGIDRVVDGKVVEGWGQLDMLGLLTTIGAVAPVPQGGSSAEKAG
jgi:predicted ester cyclase